MNQKNLQQIFANYTERFAELNDTDHDESFKWWAAEQFHALMQDALQKSGQDFVNSLQKIVKKDVVGVLIDGRMRPFRGLVEIAKNGCADEVRALFLALFAEDGGDLEKREEKIAAFLQGSEKLRLAKFPDYYSYKQTARSVAGYLFLYDPDHHYMYKATEARRFADDVEYYGDWGSGDQIRLREYYRMCDELVAEIEKCPALLATDQSRYALKGRYEILKPAGKSMADDEKHHILAYDILYCNRTYDLDRGLSFKKLSPKEKNLYEERLKAAQEKQDEYLKAEERCRQLEEAVQYYDSMLVPGVKVQNRKYGEGVVVNRDGNVIVVEFGSGTIRFDLFTAVSEGYLKFEDPLDGDQKKQYKELLKKHTVIRDMLLIRQKALKPYRDILE